MIYSVRNNCDADPFNFQPITNELNEINSYAGQFHHDNADSIPIDDGELAAFVKRALNLVHKGLP